MTHSVVIAGGGPTGLMLAAELKLAGIDVAIVERRPHQKLDGTRSRGLNSRSIEVLDQRGVAQRFLSQGKMLQIGGLAMIPLPIDDFPTRHPYGLALLQEPVERTLLAWVETELAVPIYRQREVTDFTQDERGVQVALSDGTSLRAQYLVGCDGGRSVIRKKAGIEFPGWDPSVSYLIAEVEMTQEPVWGIRLSDKGVNAIGKLGDGRLNVVSSEPQIKQGDRPTLDELRESLVAVYGTDFGVHNVTWISRFTDLARQAAAYRVGRVLLAGDAAHVHSPAGGQGLNLGLQDAVNLGWKLAQVVKGTSPQSLLDTYQAERHPIGARVLKLTMTQTGLNRGDERTQAVRETVADLLKLEEPRKRYAGMLAGLDIHYDLGPGHPLLGRRMPDLDLLTATGPTRVFTLLHQAQPVLLNLGTPAALDAVSTPWAGRVQRLDARVEGPWALPVLGSVAAPSAVLIRPDGHVAWVGTGNDAGLSEALARWFGSPT